MTNTRRPLTWADLTDHDKMSLRIAVHESSHAVAGALLGGVVRSAVMTDSRVWGVNGLTTFEEVPPSSSPAIAYAGPYGEGRWLDGRHPSQRTMRALMRGSGHGDHKSICAAAAAADVYGYSDTSAEARRTVQPLLERTWPAVINLARTIHRNSEATHDDVCKALGITDGGGRSSSQLASLKAGLRRVPPIAA
ncbi:hypothetical protein [Mycobacterium avium]|uniref:Peptidase M41 domain-containing protein n=1 Tax=Mycobacterium avium TaxID=1764 RepID=A0A2A2ZLB3_MYCAV|nr:hypothetical protein [Mycobacterium avium]ETZ52573.1 hypothetical protein L838_2340 [Mycobacterium avium MAV_120709_2344]PBA27292.1 hypothetical protein CKJ66_08450 [Mycobacterium avium]PBA42437.1 hypothetical protein CKJ63_07070 [Mycobacterium avium]PBA47244.1 hypothetical protein CKJ62_06770 [Mycobacterium avium]PBA51714.1 hypothetical protein CKJ59_07715 [Mycobacterium avium]